MAASGWERERRIVRWAGKLLLNIGNKDNVGTAAASRIETATCFQSFIQLEVMCSRFGMHLVSLKSFG